MVGEALTVVEAGPGFEVLVLGEVGFGEGVAAGGPLAAGLLEFVVVEADGAAILVRDIETRIFGGDGNGYRRLTDVSEFRDGRFMKSVAANSNADRSELGRTVCVRFDSHLSFLSIPGPHFSWAGEKEARARTWQDALSALCL
ncbi:hypothetical protein ACIP5Y_08035 [Nocardia sp. NPDC088792]|uniref:hypothetical protein n=1 Tax=Nocardia sp. NPDC088792 TaxID=3364332 RepID=UPI00382F5EA0